MKTKDKTEYRVPLYILQSIREQKIKRRERERESIFAEYIATDERRVQKLSKRFVYCHVIEQVAKACSSDYLLFFSLSLSLLLPTITRAKGFLPSLLAIQKKKNTIVNTKRHRRENKRDKKNIINLVDDSHCAYISNIHTRIYYYIRRSISLIVLEIFNQTLSRLGSSLYLAIPIRLHRTVLDLIYNARNCYTIVRIFLVRKKGSGGRNPSGGKICCWEEEGRKEGREGLNRKRGEIGTDDLVENAIVHDC